MNSGQSTTTKTDAARNFVDEDELPTTSQLTKDKPTIKQDHGKITKIKINIIALHNNLI